jgi:uncharacterized phage-associated protein
LEHQAGINYETYYKAAKHNADVERVIYSVGFTYRRYEPRNLRDFQYREENYLEIRKITNM